MTYTAYILVGFAFAGLFFAGAAYALYWAHKNGQLEDLDQGARTVFDDEEPAGRQTDFFPRGRKAKPDGKHGGAA